MLGVQSENLLQKGSGALNEDALLIVPERGRFGVFDGATSYDKYTDKDGRTSGFLAAHFAEILFRRYPGDLKDSAYTANLAIAKAMREVGVDVSDKINRWNTALAVVEILQRKNVHIEGARTVIVGAGRLVGAPSAWLLRKLGADVSMFTLQEGSIDDLKNADIIVSGAGNPGFIKPEHIKEGVALIDAGTSELNKKIAGDADPACAEKASVFTPVPGGVGPVAVAMIFRNLLDLIRD